MVVQMGERQTEDLDVAGSSPAHGITFNYFYWNFHFQNNLDFEMRLSTFFGVLKNELD